MHRNHLSQYIPLTVELGYWRYTSGTDWLFATLQCDLSQNTIPCCTLLFACVTALQITLPIFKIFESSINGSQVFSARAKRWTDFGDSSEADSNFGSALEYGRQMKVEQDPITYYKRGNHQKSTNQTNFNKHLWGMDNAWQAAMDGF